MFGRKTLFRRKSKASPPPKAAAKDAEDQELDKAATVVQSSFRGFIARKAKKVADTAQRTLERAASIGADMVGDIGKGVVSMFDETHDTRDEATIIAEVERQTPEGEWFTPKEGWPKHMLERGPTWQYPPKLLVPTAQMEPSLFSEGSNGDDGAIGTLLLEVLEAERLPTMDGLFGSVDPYAIVVFEGNAARTSTIRRTKSPRWPCGVARAFRFPIHCPYACCYVSMKDADIDGVDDDIGRVVIELGSLYARTTYDCWLPLQRQNIRLPGRRGAVRLRFSISFKSDRTRLMRYVHPVSPPSYHIPFLSKKDKNDARFALVGRLPDSE